MNFLTATLLMITKKKVGDKMQITKAENLNKTENFRVCLYAKPGTGKTYSHRYLKGKTLILDMDHSAKVLAGVKDIDVVQFDRGNPSESINEFLKWFPTVIDDYDNLAIDNMSSWEKDWFVWRGKSTKSGINNELQDYAAWSNYFIRVMTAIYAFDLNIVATAWEQTQDLTLQNGQIISQYAPALRHQVLSVFMGLTDIVGRVQINSETGARGVILEGSDNLFAKNRLDERKACKIEELYNFTNV